MDCADLAARIDHTVLGPATTSADVRRLMDEAREYGTNACVPPCYVKEATDHAPSVTLATVVGFPHGQHAVGVKRSEATRAHEDGADELDMVPNLGRLKAGETMRVREEIETIVDAVPIPVKVIIETAILDQEEKHEICEIARDAEADFVKTSTGLADGGATVEDVELMAGYLPVKASGGIGSWEEAEAMFNAGASRIGASSGIEIVEEFEAETGG